MNFIKRLNFNVIIILTVIVSMFILSLCDFNENNMNFKFIDKETSNTSNHNITVYRSDGTLVNLKLEEYLIGVVSSEMPASFNEEALKAQAIASRTYALNKINNNLTITDTTKDQVYKDNEELKLLWEDDYDFYYNKIKEAVNDTAGLILTYNDKLIDAVYHSTSNGYTKDALDVWGNDTPYLKSVSSPYDLEASSYSRELIYTGNIINLDSNIEIIEDPTGNVINITVDDNFYTGTEFRTLLNLRSTDFEILIEDEIIIQTKGYGHGVGMSQYGANGMANNGYTYDEILTHYYTGTQIKKAN